jgi:hypothetical protein
MTFLWRNRNQNIVNIAAGFGFGLGMATVVGQNPDKFGLSHHKYCDGWIRKDYTLSKFHVLYRIKGFAVFLQQLLTENDVTVPNRPNLPREHYRIVFDDPTLQKEIEYEKFDYNIIKTGISAFADTLVNEVFVMFRMLWRTRGGFTAKIIYDQELDTREFGERNVGPYWASHRFKIDHDGNWQADFVCEFKQPPAKIKPADPMEPRAPFFAQDYSRETSNAAQRARKIAKPDWKGGDDGRDHEEFMALLAEEEHLNKTVDLSFKHKWKGTGYWGNVDEHIVDVPDEHVRETFGESIEVKQEKLISPIIDKKDQMLKNFKSNIPGM